MKKHAFFLKLLSVISLILFLSGCNSKKISFKPNVSGKAGEIIVAIDKGQWESEVGSELRSILAKDYPLLPQREPSFNLINIRSNALNNLLKVHRNIMIVNVGSNYNDANLSIQEDVWAIPQTVVVLSAPDAASAVALLKEKGNLIFSAIEQAERNRIIRNSKKFEEKSLREMVAAEFGGSPYFPRGYSLKKKTENFMWISYETTRTNQGVFIYRIPYHDTLSLSLNNLIEERNEILKQNVPAMLDDSYMTTSTAVEPELKWIKYKGNSFAEVRGWWDAQNDFMGGPFVMHAFYNPNGKDIIVLDGFVYAPSKDKRNLLRQVESFLYSFEWDNK